MPEKRVTKNGNYAILLFTLELQEAAGWSFYIQTAGSPSA